MKTHKTSTKQPGDLVVNGENWIYSQKVKDHFYHPRNFIKNNQPAWKYNAYGESGSAACGDVMKIWLYINPKTKRIEKFGWKTFGCASAIAATSILSEIVVKKKGMLIKDAYKISPQKIIAALNGLPIKKVHCSVLSDRALRNAIDSFTKKAV